MSAHQFLLRHVANQMQLDVAFLESQNYLSPQDAATMKEIIGRLPVETRTQIVPASKGTPEYVRAVWSYNEDGAETNDLSFAAGETIEIVSERNEDWCVGRARGKEGLFPLNHVERIKSPAPPPATRAYHPFGAALHGNDVPPPNGAGVNSLGLQQASGQVEKKAKFGALGNSMAQSAACGVGFGAAAAVGGGLVSAIL